MASESTSSKPRKGILKSSSSIDHSKKDKIEWDEMNILATLHPADKDYGFMKVDEPPTPYNRAAVSDGEDEEGKKGSADNLLGVDPNDLASRLKSGDDLEKKFVDGEEDDSEDDSTLTEEERARKKAFLKKRKIHYNEFQAVQLAKKLMAQDKEDDDDEASTSAGAMSGVCSDQCSSSPNKNKNNDNEEESIECLSSSNQDGDGDGGD